MESIPAVKPNEAEQTSTIHISNLGDDIKASDLQDLFGSFGPIHEILCKTRISAKVDAYINFSHRNDAERAVHCLNGFCYDNRILVVDWSNDPDKDTDSSLSNKENFEKAAPPPKKTGIKFPKSKKLSEMATIRVDNLPRKLKSSYVQNMFRTFGTIARFYLPKDMNTREYRGFAYIKYDHCDSAAQAVELMNGFTYDDNALKVKWVTKGTTNARPVKELGPIARTKKEPKLTVCVQNFPKYINRPVIVNLFKPFGEIREVLKGLDREKKFKGIAHIVFGHHEAACHAIEFMNGFVYDNHILLVDWMLKPRKVKTNASNNDNVKNQSPSDESTNRTIRVENMPYDTKAEDLHSMFRAFGAITDTNIVKDNINLARSTATVGFRTREDAILAIELMNGFIYSNVTLRVKWEVLNNPKPLISQNFSNIAKKAFQ